MLYFPLPMTKIACSPLVYNALWALLDALYTRISESKHSRTRHSKYEQKRGDKQAEVDNLITKGKGENC